MLAVDAHVTVELDRRGPWVANGIDARGTADEIWVRTAASPNGHGSADKLPDMSIIRRNQIAAPRFPLEMIDSAVADWMQSVAENKSAPVEYVFVSTLASAAAMIGPKRRCSPWLGWEEPLDLLGCAHWSAKYRQEPILRPASTRRASGRGYAKC